MSDFSTVNFRYLIETEYQFSTLRNFTVLELTNTQQCLNNGSGKSADLNSGHNVLYRCRSNERGQNHAVLKVNVPAKIWKCLMFHVNECNAFIFIRLNEEDGVS